MNHFEAAAVAAAASATTTTASPNIQIKAFDSSQIPGSFEDEVSLKECMVRSRSGSSSSLKISIDLQPGLTASNPSPNVRRGSSTVRNRSPNASQERYMPYNATSPRSPRSPLSPRASTSPFLVHSPPPPTSPSPTHNFSSAPPLSSSPSYASQSVLSFDSPPVQSGPARSPPQIRPSSCLDQQRPRQQRQQQQEWAAFGRHLHRHNSNEGVPASESLTGRSLLSESSERFPSSYPQFSHSPPSSSLPQRQTSNHDHPNSHPDNIFPRPHRHAQPQHHHHSGSQYYPLSTLNDRQGAECNKRMSQDYPERIEYHCEDEAPRQQQHHHHFRHSHQQQNHHHQRQPQQPQHHGHPGRPQDRYQDTLSEHPADRTSQYFHASNTSRAPTSLYIHPSSSSPAAHGAFSSFSQPTRRSSHHPHSQGQEHYSQQHGHVYTSHPNQHHLMTSEHAERTSVPSHANASEPASSTHGLPYGVSRTSSSSHLPPHSSSSSTASLSSVSGSISVHASSPSSSSAIAAGSAGRSVPAGSTTSSVTVTTTASGEIKTTRRRRRPNESYSTIIIKAIRNSPLQRLKLSEIYDYVSREIPTMDGNDKGWQNTVRHNLSHNKCFRRIVLKDEDMPSGSADDDDGESRQSASNTGKSSKQAKRGKGGCWVLVPENLEESMSSSRPKKGSTDQGQSPAAPGVAGSALISSTSPKRHHHTPGPSGEAIFPKATMKSATGSTGANLSPQLSKEYTHSHPHSNMMDIDGNVASMMIAEQQFQQSGRNLGPHMHPSQNTPPHPHSHQTLHYSTPSGHIHAHHHQQQQHHQNVTYPYLPPNYPSSSSSSSPTSSAGQPGSSSTTFQPFTPITRLGQQHNYSSGEDKDHGSESDDGQSGHFVLSADRENDGDYEEDEVMDAMEEDEDSVSHSSSSRRSPSCSPSASSLSATASSPMEIEEMDGGNGGLSSSSSPTTDRRRPGMSIQNMLN